jgi:hypothetical protein
MRVQPAREETLDNVLLRSSVVTSLGDAAAAARYARNSLRCGYNPTTDHDSGDKPALPKIKISLLRPDRVCLSKGWSPGCEMSQVQREGPTGHEMFA